MKENGHGARVIRLLIIFSSVVIISLNMAPSCVPGNEDHGGHGHADYKTYNTPDYAFDVQVVSDFIFVADRFSGLRVFHILDNDPIEIEWFSHMDTPGEAYGVALGYNGTDAYAFMADGYYGLTPILADDLSNLGLLYSDTSGGQSAVKVYPVDWWEDVNKLLVANGGNISIFDFDPWNYLGPDDAYWEGNCPVDNWANDVTFAGNVDEIGELYGWIYVAQNEMGLKIMDYWSCDPIFFLDTPGYATGIDLIDSDHVLIADGVYGLQNIALYPDPDEDQMVSINTPGYAYKVKHWYGATRLYAFVADGPGGLAIIDITDRNNPFIYRQLFQYEGLDVRAVDIVDYEAGTLVFLAAGTKGLVVKNIGHLP